MKVGTVNRFRRSPLFPGAATGGVVPAALPGARAGTLVACPRHRRSTSRPHLPHTRGVDNCALRWLDPPAGPAVTLLDQTRLPAEEAYLTCRDIPALDDAIRRLVVRGAPLLGLAGAFGVALAAFRGDDVAAAAARLAASRPTAVNLSWGAHRALAAYQAAGGRAVPLSGDASRRAARAALDEARSIAAADAAASAAIAGHGLALVREGARILTHCNTGALVSAGEGTAFAIVLAAHRAGRLARLWVDETRPLLQGARLTAYEAGRAGIPYAVLPDSAAASLMAAGEVDVVLTGADRVAADGSAANKVGTYALAVLAHHHGVPFVVAAPVSTIDFRAAGAAAITVEHRAAQEVTSFAGVRVAPADSPVYNPAFDVTPPELITALVTERGVISPVSTGTLQYLDDAAGASSTALGDVSVER
jgi:methylthioribose-1-phosphate isomerase